MKGLVAMVATILFGAQDGVGGASLRDL